MINDTIRLDRIENKSYPIRSYQVLPVSVFEFIRYPRYRENRVYYPIVSCPQYFLSSPILSYPVSCILYPVSYPILSYRTMRLSCTFGNPGNSSRYRTKAPGITDFIYFQFSTNMTPHVKGRRG